MLSTVSDSGVYLKYSYYLFVCVYLSASPFQGHWAVSGHLAAQITPHVSPLSLSLSLSHTHIAVDGEEAVNKHSSGCLSLDKEEQPWGRRRFWRQTETHCPNVQTACGATGTEEQIHTQIQASVLYSDGTVLEQTDLSFQLSSVVNLNSSKSQTLTWALLKLPQLTEGVGYFQADIWSVTLWSAPVSSFTNKT